MSRDWMATLLHSVLLAVRNMGVVTAIQNPPVRLQSFRNHHSPKLYKLVKRPLLFRTLLTIQGESMKK